MYIIFSSFHAYDRSFLLAQTNRPDALRNRYRKFYEEFCIKIAISCRIRCGYRSIFHSNNDSLLLRRIRPCI